MLPARVPRMPTPRFDYVDFNGGLDTETPRWKVPTGTLRDGQNVEISINGGYRRIKGYERFDGNTAPSDATYSILNVTITGSFSTGDTITQQNSGATAVVLEVVDNDDQDYLVITKITGTFNDSDDLEVSSTVEGTASSQALPRGGSTPLLDAQYLNLAADEYRDDISAVPGSGDILGVILYNDIVYAFRNNAGGTAADLYKSTSSGWTQIDLGLELEFTGGGTDEIEEGDTITGATSSATADVERVILTSGSWAGGDAAGKFILSNQTGTFQSENIDVGASTNLATISGDSSAITLSPSGRYEFRIANFGGQAGTERVYGVDGVNRGFEFNGTAFVPIDTGVTNDAPTHVEVHKNHLFFSFGSSAQHSGTGEPYSWSPVFGAAELAVGDTITGFKKEPGAQGGATLAIYSRDVIHMLYGSSSSDWELVSFREEVGAYPYSIQQFGVTFFFDDRGITNLKTVQAYGNFLHATLSRNIQDTINAKKNLVTASCISREKSQYRVFFSDGSALFMTTNGEKTLGITPVVMEDDVTCITSQENSSGDELIYFGSSDGFVYQMERGTSFDGNKIEWFFDFHFNFSRSILMLKKYLDVTLETEGDGYASFSMRQHMDYSSTDVPQPGAQTSETSFSDTTWDSGAVWDTGTWDGATLTPDKFKLTGSAENISLTLRGNADFHSALQFNGAYMAYLMRRRKR